MKIENEIISSVIAAVKELYGQDVPEKMVALQKTKRSEEHTSELQSRFDLVCRLLLEKKKKNTKIKQIQNQ